jgi:hypothetical protein
MTETKDRPLARDDRASENSLPQAEGDWSIFTDPNHYRILGFLQMCIEKRFHLAVQERFKKETSLVDVDYWIHTDVGGSPNMEGHVAAPRYCYTQGARIMGWSAHGSNCGGFPGKSDAEILAALKQTLQGKSKLYPEARHLGFFAKEGPRGDDVEILFIELETPQSQKE